MAASAASGSQRSNCSKHRWGYERGLLAETPQSTFHTVIQSKSVVAWLGIHALCVFAAMSCEGRSSEAPPETGGEAGNGGIAGSASGGASGSGGSAGMGGRGGTAPMGGEGGEVATGGTSNSPGGADGEDTGGAGGGGDRPGGAGGECNAGGECSETAVCETSMACGFGRGRLSCAGCTGGYADCTCQCYLENQCTPDCEAFRACTYECEMSWC